MKARTKTFYKKCPECETVSGFDLPETEIKKDEKYFCEVCGKEFKLSKWKPNRIKAWEFLEDKREI